MERTVMQCRCSNELHVCVCVCVCILVRRPSQDVRRPSQDIRRPSQDVRGQSKLSMVGSSSVSAGFNSRRSSHASIAENYYGQEGSAIATPPIHHRCAQPRATELLTRLI